MLKSLRVKNILLVEELDIEFCDGLCVITGETGSGKSILLNCLGLIRGNKVTTQVIRPGCDQATVTAIFESKGSRALLEEAGIEDDGELIIRRVIDNTGKSKAYINDVVISLNFLRQISDELLELHGQGEQYQMLDASSHLSLVDQFIGHDALLSKLTGLYQNIRETESELVQMLSTKQQHENEKAFLEFAVSELRNLNVQENEEQHLSDKRLSLKSVDKKQKLFNELIQKLKQADFTTMMFGIQKQFLNNQNILFDEIEVVEAVNKSIETVIDELDKIQSNLGQLLVNTAGPERLEELETRWFALKDASNKYKIPVNDLGVYVQECESKLSNLEKVGNNIEHCENKLLLLRGEYKDLACDISKARQKAALEISKRIIEELKFLRLDKARFEVEVIYDEDAAVSAMGRDKVQFLASTNLDMPMSRLSKIASGGELSRFMLAMKVILASQKQSQTMIFDEIDTGIGGATADAVGDRLKLLGDNVQIIVVTHHPQVAAKANLHLLVNKVFSNNTTSIVIDLLNQDGRIEEIARMLSGADISLEARAAAQKLLKIC